MKRRHERRRSIGVFDIFEFWLLLVFVSCAEGSTNGGSSNFLLRSVSCLITGGDVAAVSPDAADSAERESWKPLTFRAAALF